MRGALFFLTKFFMKKNCLNLDVSLLVTTRTSKVSNLRENEHLKLEFNVANLIKAANVSIFYEKSNFRDFSV